MDARGPLLFNTLQVQKNDERSHVRAFPLYLWFGFLFLLVVVYPAGTDNSLRHTYLERTGDDKLLHTLVIRRNGNNVETRWIAPEKSYFNLCDSTGDTLEWRVSDKEGEIKGKREGNVIQLEGVRKGKVIRRSVEIGGAPWFQPPSYALGRFSKSQRESIDFWTIRPDTLKPVKLHAKRLGKESVEIETGAVAIRKVRISLTGLLSDFWAAHYWFRESDGLFFPYKGANGLPGTPVTTIQLES